MTVALEGGEWSAACPGCTLPPENTQYPFYRRLGWFQCRSGWAKNLVPTGIQSQTSQPVVSRYTQLTQMCGEEIRIAPHLLLRLLQCGRTLGGTLVFCLMLFMLVY